MPALSVMRAEVLTEADSTDVVAAAVVDTILNEELAELHDLLTESFEDYAVTSGSLTMTANADSTALAAAFYKVRAVEDTANDDEPLTRFNWEDRKRVGRLSYCILGSNLIVRPKQTASRSYKVWYVPVYTALSADGDAFTAPNNWYKLAIFAAAARVKGLQELDAAELVAKAERVRGRIEKAASKRDAGEPQKVRDVRGARKFLRQLETFDPEPF